MLDTAARFAFNEDHAMFRDTVRQVFARELIPNLDRFEEEGIVSRDFWRACGDAGMLCPTVKEEHGGLGLDFGFNVVVAEELAYAGSSAGITLQNDITAEYIEVYGSPEQHDKYLPKMVSGECITAIAMTEPGTGSDLQGIRTTARKDGNHYIINGSKTYITNGQNADVIIVAAKTNPELGAKGVSLILVDADTAGFKRGRNLDKIGQHSADTSELFFEDVRVPISNCLGQEGQGFIYLMSQLPQERLSIAVSAQAAAQRAFDEAVSFTKERQAFGQAVFQFQNTKFTLADMKSQLQVGWAHLDWAINRHLAGVLTTAEASAAKQWHTDMQGRVIDMALQLHGGAGYMNEYMVARLWRDARVTRIFGGTNEIMKEVVSRSL
ncbi:MULTISPECIES: acyl-CoA dehydrogenase family protein [Sphingobium]|jgi:acyl-CoA dehydrogenase|uniref:acyl-CoA dehydrogenase family protein n=1 Tax=Sphingobium TaxID=165695 RepID=UPI000C36B38D|nr:MULTISPECIES: acyl-CoA dehydrogenase family protein [Sphingobium]MBS48726.1 acyl-CoA dehydrogenase [Sphingobium sp.]MCC4258788.1 acyl-CoA dehydrogenase family protein [Sphingobium lactosutens]MEE2741764.1 acyl-CoA dehydrogenase family protein [Pseudomonadota bacterium]HCW59381.1 acyl-CoA dehydrogenase [Sphingobium sp.]|tara:strand:- start:102 stop:1244 length:1143 start_codon:yes stop_codon:yes gene_type:complete